MLSRCYFAWDCSSIDDSRPFELMLQIQTPIQKSQIDSIL